MMVLKRRLKKQRWVEIRGRGILKEMLVVAQPEIVRKGYVFCMYETAEVCVWVQLKKA